MQLSKPQIRTYLEDLYNVRVTTIDTAVIRGKIKRGNVGLFKRSDYKKAYVTIANPEPAPPAAAAAPVAKADA